MHNSDRALAFTRRAAELTRNPKIAAEAESIYKTASNNAAELCEKQNYTDALDWIDLVRTLSHIADPFFFMN